MSTTKERRRYWINPEPEYGGEVLSEEHFIHEDPDTLRREYRHVIEFDQKTEVILSRELVEELLKKTISLKETCNDSLGAWYASPSVREVIQLAKKLNLEISERRGEM